MLKASSATMKHVVVIPSGSDFEGVVDFVKRMDAIVSVYGVPHVTREKLEEIAAAGRGTLVIGGRLQSLAKLVARPDGVRRVTAATR